MYTAIYQRRRIAAAQNKFLQRVRQTFPARIPNIVAGYPGGRTKPLVVFANNTIWFGHQSLTDARIPRNWNAFGIAPPTLRRSNDITVEVNMALDGVDKRVAGLFAHNDETGDIVLLHRGRIGGGGIGVGKNRFIKWYPGTTLTFSDPSREKEEDVAIFVANLHSNEFPDQIESFVDAVHAFKSSGNQDDPREMSNDELREKAITAPAKPKSSTTVSVSFTRNQHVVELTKRRARGKCELCRKRAPFNNTSGDPYLECHHIVWLAHGGDDRLENTVALCPNCHRKMHVVNDPNDIEKLQSRAKQ